MELREYKTDRQYLERAAEWKMNEDKAKQARVMIANAAENK
jgi:hypothetical protein